MVGYLKTMMNMSTGPVPNSLKLANGRSFFRSQIHLNWAIDDATGKIKAANTIVVKTLTSVLTLTVDRHWLSGFLLKVARTMIRIRRVRAPKSHAKTSKIQGLSRRRVGKDNLVRFCDRPTSSGVSAMASVDWYWSLSSALESSW